MDFCYTNRLPKFSNNINYKSWFCFEYIWLLTTKILIVNTDCRKQLLLFFQEIIYFCKFNLSSGLILIIFNNNNNNSFLVYWDYFCNFHIIFLLVLLGPCLEYIITTVFYSMKKAGELKWLLYMKSVMFLLKYN